MFSSYALNDILNKYRERKLAHAYLIETNNIDMALKDVKELIKIINCPSIYKKDCKDCQICHLTDINNIPSVKIVEPDGQMIKKNQIEELKNNFKALPTYTKYNIYIIIKSEKLNVSSANSMLKFIEEPNNGIIGFFITSNKDVIIDTIKSRCQIYTINYDFKNIVDDLNIYETELENYNQIIKNFLYMIDENIYINCKKTILKELPEKKQIQNMLKIVFEIYYNTYLKNIGARYDEDIIKLYEVKDKNELIIKKVKIITDILQNMNYNVNSELILDKFVLEMRGINE